jgi:UDPglucose 6-dehydrogenase/GDP-mannose 6-dehydrogenase
MKVSIIGTGYVGLVTAVCLAHKGHKVTCVDIDSGKVAKINQGISPIHEKGLPDLLKEHVHVDLSATTDLNKAVLDTEISLIAVGTPFDGDEIDLSFIKEVASQIGKALQHKPNYHCVIVKSTVVPGTTDGVVTPLLEKESGKTAGKDFGVGMNPEFLREGEAVGDFLSPDRIVLGGMDERTLDMLAGMYAVFSGVPFVRTNNKTAEMIKYTSNCLLGTMISFSNEIGNLCAGLGDIDALEVMKGVHLDKRLSPILSDGTRITPSFTTYLEAGCGFGGSCFPKDIKALIAHGKKAGNPMRLLHAVMQINEEQPWQILSRLLKHFPSLAGIRLAVLGLAFKPGTDDMRESPAIPIVRSLMEQNAKIKAYDPVARHEAEKLFDHQRIVFCDDLAEALAEAEAILILTRWDEFRRIPDLIAHMSPQPLVIDGRRMLEKGKIQRYEGIGVAMSGGKNDHP